MRKNLSRFTSSVSKFAKQRKWLLLILLVVVLGGGYLWYSNRRNAKPSADYMLQPVTKEDLVRSTSNSSSVSSASVFNGGFDSDDTVAAVYVKAGDKVTAGQAMAAIDDIKLKIAFNQADLALKQAKTERDNAYRFHLSATAKQTADLAVDQAQLNYDTAQKKLNNAVLRSPIAGTVMQVNIAVGDKAPALGSNTKNTDAARAAAAIVVMDTNHLMVTLQISDAEIADIKAGQQTQITFDNYPMHYDGVVSNVDLLSTQQNNVSFYNVTITFTQPANDVKIGMVANVTIVLEEKKNVLSVPRNAISVDQKGEYVEVQNGQNFDKKYITRGISNDIQTEVTDGVREGDMVKVNFDSAPSGGFGGKFVNKIGG
jgi:macrolide-specific efflux system membrane fusion protein